LFGGRAENLSENERMVIDLVMKTFGKYSGKVLEMITHSEKPWQDAREGYHTTERSNVVIPKEDIKLYFEEVSEKYGINSVEGLNRYINAQLESVS